MHGCKEIKSPSEKTKLAAMHCVANKIIPDRFLDAYEFAFLFWKFEISVFVPFHGAICVRNVKVRAVTCLCARAYVFVNTL